MDDENKLRQTADREVNVMQKLWVLLSPVVLGFILDPNKLNIPLRY